MTRLRVWLTRTVALIGRTGRDRALQEEIQAHLDELVEALMESGLPEIEAKAEARRQFGNVERMKAAYRDQRGWPRVDELRQDIRLALRLIWRHRQTSILAVLSVSLGVAVSIAFFTIVNAICFRGLPLDEPDSVLFLTTHSRDATAAGLSHGDFTRVAGDAVAFSAVAAYTPTAFSLADEGHAPARLSGTYVSAAAFSILGVTPVLGRPFRDTDEHTGAPAVVIISHATWQNQFGAAPDIAGRAVRLNGARASVIGVMPEGFGFPSQAHAWVPLGVQPEIVDQPRTRRTLAVFARLREGTSAADAGLALDRIAADLAQAYPDANAGIQFRAVPINERFNGRATDPVWLVFLTAGVLVLLVGCATGTNVLLASAVRRRHELALRMALGATRLRIARQLLVESGVLAVISGVVGLGLSLIAVRLLASSVPPSAPLPYWIAFTIDLRVLVALVLCSSLGLLLIGAVPAVYSVRGGVPTPLTRGAVGEARHARSRRVLRGFLVAQFALTLVLLANVSPEIRSGFAEPAGTPIDPEPLLTTNVALPAATYGTPAERRQFFDTLIERMEGLPFVQSMTLAPRFPPDTGTPARLRLFGQVAAPGEEGEAVDVVRIGPRYFETLGLPLVAGRTLVEADGRPGQHGALVSQHLAEQLFVEGALGQRIAPVEAQTSDGDVAWRTVVGVAPDIRTGDAPRRVVYLPWDAGSPSAAILIRSLEEPEPLAAAVRRVVMDLDPDLPLGRAVPLATAQYEAAWNGRASSALLRSICGVALILALVGLYAVTAHGVTERRRELGIRIALGASPVRVMNLIVRQALTTVTLGLAVGLPLTYLFGLAFGASAAGGSVAAPANLWPVVLLTLLAAVGAGAIPARAAARTPASITMRAE